MQYLTRHLQELETEESYISPSKTRMTAASLHRYLSKLMYARRNKFDPLWNSLMVGGLDEDDKPFLACADLRGTTYAAPCIATGYGSMLATPIMRRTVPDEAAVEKVTLEEAVEVVKECMKVLYYRDARSLDRYSIAVVTKDGVDLKLDEKLEGQSWAFAERIKGYGTQVV
jgi:20S proteasome subunit beta 7